MTEKHIKRLFGIHSGREKNRKSSWFCWGATRIMKELKDFGHLLTNTGGWVYRQLKGIIIKLWKINLVGNEVADIVMSIVIILIYLMAIALRIRFL